MVAVVGLLEAPATMGDLQEAKGTRELSGVQHTQQKQQARLDSRWSQLSRQQMLTLALASQS
jgi:hypothetical protein